MDNEEKRVEDIPNKVDSKKKEKRNNNIIRPLYFAFFVIMVVLLTIAYGYLATMLGVKVNGPKEIETLNWRIEWDNVKENEGSVTAIQKATIDKDTKTKITYEIELPSPGTYYSFNADIKNRGNIDAKISEIIEKGIPADQRKFLDYSVKYTDGKTPSKDDELKAGETKTITVLVKFRDDLTNPADLPKGGEVLNLTYQIVYVEK